MLWGGKMGLQNGDGYENKTCVHIKIPLKIRPSFNFFTSYLVLNMYAKFPIFRAAIEGRNDGTHKSNLKYDKILVYHSSSSLRTSLQIFRLFSPVFLLLTSKFAEKY